MRMRGGMIGRNEPTISKSKGARASLSAIPQSAWEKAEELGKRAKAKAAEKADEVKQAVAQAAQAAREKAERDAGSSARAKAAEKAAEEEANENEAVAKEIASAKAKAEAIMKAAELEKFFMEEINMETFDKYEEGDLDLLLPKDIKKLKEKIKDIDLDQINLSNEQLQQDLKELKNNNI